MSKKEKKEQFISPIGRAIWPYLHAPDKKFKKEYGEYRVKLALTEEEAAPLIERIEAAAEESFRKAKEEFQRENKGKTFEKQKQGKRADLPIKVGEGEDAGIVEFNFKKPAGGKRKSDGEEYTTKVAVFDAKGKPLPPSKRVGSGSRIKIAYTLNPFSTPVAGTGVSLRLEGVQVIELVEFGDRSAKSFGFGEEEGFSVNESAETSDDTDEEEETGGKDEGADF